MNHRKKKIGGVILCYVLIFSFFLLGTILGNRTVTVIAQNSPEERTHTIVIDPGHGGEDGGSTSCTGKLESGFNLEIALRLDDMLHLLGHDTVILRKTDISIYTKGDTIAQKKISDLKERVRIANSTSNAILISIHQNFFTESQYSGPQVFFGNSEGSEALAKEMQTKLSEVLSPGSRRQSKKGSGIYLLDKITCPGILIECGFISNPQEEELLRSEEYQKKLVSVIASCISGWVLDQ